MIPSPLQIIASTVWVVLLWCSFIVIIVIFDHNFIMWKIKASQHNLAPNPNPPPAPTEKKMMRASEGVNMQIITFIRGMLQITCVDLKMEWKAGFLMERLIKLRLWSAFTSTLELYYQKQRLICIYVLISTHCGSNWRKSQKCRKKKWLVSTKIV